MAIKGVSPNEEHEGTYDFECQVPQCGFVSSRHSTRKDATTRGEEHLLEHEVLNEAEASEEEEV